MKRKDEMVIPVLMLLISAAFGISALVSCHNQTVEAEQVHIIHATPDTVIGNHATFKGNLINRYTLVEFGDYECPPCRHSNPQIEEYLRHYPDDLRFTFRNLPLKRIHRLAYSAALTAEVARNQGRFWDVHDLLYKDSNKALNLHYIHAAMNVQNVNRIQLNRSSRIIASSVIQNDIETAQHLGVISTPTFLLCCPDGKVVHLDTLKQITGYMPQHIKLFNHVMM